MASIGGDVAGDNWHDSEVIRIWISQRWNATADL